MNAPMSIPQNPEKAVVSKLLGIGGAALLRVVERSAPRATPRQLCEVLGYGRKSTRGQREATMEQQREDILAYTKRQGLRTPVMFEDKGVSGRLEKRAGMNALLERVRPGTIVVCRESTRFARDVFIFLKIYREILKRGGAVEFVNVGQADSIYLTIMGAIADYDFQKTVMQLRNGRVSELRAGKLLRKLVWAYIRMPDGSFRIDEKKAVLVRKAFAMRRAGATLQAIADAFIAEGAEGAIWSPARISSMLNNALYAGFIITKIPRFEFEEKRYGTTEGSAASMLQSMFSSQLDEEDEEEGIDLGVQAFIDAADEVLDDFVIFEDTSLRIIDPAEFRAVSETRRSGERRKFDNTNMRHPLLEKCVCGHDDGVLRINGTAMRCSNAHDHGPCTAPTYDRLTIDKAMISALRQLSSQHEGSFGLLATQTYEETLATELAYRKGILEDIAALEQSIADNAFKLWKNKDLAAQMEVLSDQASAELLKKRAQLAELDKEPEPPDPRTSLLELGNMLDQLEGDPNIPYDASEDMLALRDSLGALVHSVRLQPNADGTYDLEFTLDGAKALSRRGSAPTVVTVRNQHLLWSDNERERALSRFSAAWAAREHSLTDEEWASRPDMPMADLFYGDRLRDALDLLVHIGECHGRLGEELFKRIDSPLTEAQIRHFRGTRERELARDWLRRIRPREHDWICITPEGYRSSYTLREKMEKVGHQFIDLAGCQPGAPDVVLTDAQWAPLESRLATRHPEARRRVSGLFAIVRDDGPHTWTGEKHMSCWIKSICTNGDLLAITEYFHKLEGKKLVGPVPDIPFFTRAGSRTPLGEVRQHTTRPRYRTRRGWRKK